MKFDELRKSIIDSGSIDYQKIIEFISMNIENQTKFSEIYKMTRRHIPRIVYKYFSFTEDDNLNRMKLETLSNKTLYMCSHKYMNDPFDNMAFYYDNEVLANFERLKHCNGHIFDDIMDKHILTCFTSAGTNCMPMWAHYSNNHQGYCISYDTGIPENRMMFSTMMPVQYIGTRIDITDYLVKFIGEVTEQIERDIPNGIKKHVINDLTLPLMTSFYSYIKHESWSYEKELRCSVGDSAVKGQYLDAVPNEIFIGTNCSEENRKHLIDIGSFFDIKVYDMTFNRKSSKFNLQADSIDF